jgi:hypothetical protein
MLSPLQRLSIENNAQLLELDVHPKRSDHVHHAYHFSGYQGS